MRLVLVIVALVLVIVGILLYRETRRAPAPLTAPPSTPVHDAPAPVVPVDASTIVRTPDVAVDARFAPPALESLRNSGTANEVWVPDATRLVETIAPGATVECYVAGCGAVLSFPSDAAYQDAVRAIADDHTWTGGKRWTEEVRGNGQITVALILYRPD